MSNINKLNNYTDINQSLYAWLLVSQTAGIGYKTMVKLLKQFKTAENILAQDFTTLSYLVNRTIAKALCERSAEKVVHRTLTWANESDTHNLLTLNDSRYPKELAAISSPPMILYLKGNLQLLQNPKIAIVGTRHPTPQGCENAFKFAKELSNNNFTIVSGMALGVDKYAHLGATEGAAKTIGVIGTGIDIQYPKSNNQLYEKVLNNAGLIISEFSIGSQPTVSSFPQRNRVIAGLSKGCLVIESTIDGGSMISANHALEMGREVMAIPGSIHNPVTRGCHKLIKSGAKLVEHINDILEEFCFDYSIIQQNNLITDPILTAMGFDPIGIDTLCINLNTSFSDICAKLLDLELNGKIVNCGNGNYQRIFK